jgi:hypothetical protein
MNKNEIESSIKMIEETLSAIKGSISSTDDIIEAVNVAEDVIDEYIMNVTPTQVLSSIQSSTNDLSMLYTGSLFRPKQLNALLDNTQIQKISKKSYKKFNQHLKNVENGLEDDINFSHLFEDDTDDKYNSIEVLTLRNNAGGMVLLTASLSTLSTELDDDISEVDDDDEDEDDDDEDEDEDDDDDDEDDEDEDDEEDDDKGEEDDDDDNKEEEEEGGDKEENDDEGEEKEEAEEEEEDGDKEEDEGNDSADEAENEEVDNNNENEDDDNEKGSANPEDDEEGDNDSNNDDDDDDDDDIDDDDEESEKIKQNLRTYLVR